MDVRQFVAAGAKECRRCAFQYFHIQITPDVLGKILFLGKGLFMGSAAMILAAFAGSMISMGFVLVIARRDTAISLAANPWI